MSAKDRNAITEEIKAHIRKQGGAYRSWYVGVTSDIEQGLFNDHNVHRKTIGILSHASTPPMPEPLRLICFVWA